MTSIKGLVALVLALAPAFAAAETVYKYQRPDGSTVYSDVPLRGAKLIGRFQLVPAPLPKAEPARPGRGAITDPNEIARQRVQDLDAADAAIKAAEQSLNEALERQQAGVEPQPGERLGNVGGRSRLAPNYFKRQRALAAGRLRDQFVHQAWLEVATYQLRWTCDRLMELVASHRAHDHIMFADRARQRRIVSSAMQEISAH